jgi:hypothetical protein
MPGALAALVLLLTALDHWTTYLCLRGQLPGWQVSEANPLAAWLFARLGLVAGLALDSAVTLAAVLFVLGTGLLPRPAKSACLALLVVTTGFAAANNLGALATLGLSVLGGME